MNNLWAGMILIGIFYGAVTGNMQLVADSILESAKEAVMLCITMTGILSMWTGIMKIAQEAGIVQAMAGALRPFVHFLFPNIPRGHKAMEHITTNMIANILGLGWAATPAGLLAMEELAKLEGEKRKWKKGTASNEMCTFLVMNISSLQLIPVNIIAYRSQYGSANPAAVVGPGIVATAVSTLVAVVVCKVKSGRKT